MPPDHLVIGCECSGVEWFAALLGAHPDRGTVYVCTFPSAKGDGMVYYPPGGGAAKTDALERFGDIIALEGGRTRVGEAERYMPDINRIDPDEKMVLWLCTRDRSCTSASLLEKRGTDPPPEQTNPFGVDLELPRLHMASQLTERAKAPIFVSYETLVQWGGFYLRGLFEEGGLDPALYDFNGPRYVDENAMRLIPKQGAS